METIESYLEKELKVEISYDEYSINPLEEENGQKLISLHRRYGENYGYKSPNEICIDAKQQKAILFQVYLYDHSGLAFSLLPFSCPWDSGLYGYFWINKKTLTEITGYKNKTKKAMNRIQQYVQGLLNAYQAYCNGQIYGYTVTDKFGELVDSCWGYNDWDYMKTEITAVIQGLQERKLKKKQTKLKAYVVNHVPLINRFT